MRNAGAGKGVRRVAPRAEAPEPEKELQDPLDQPVFDEPVDKEEGQLVPPDREPPLDQVKTLPGGKARGEGINVFPVVLRKPIHSALPRVYCG